MSFKNWVLDVTNSHEQIGLYTFCPYEVETEDVIIGFGYMGEIPPGKLVGVIHMGGQDYVDEWLKDNEKLFLELQRKSNETNSQP